MNYADIPMGVKVQISVSNGGDTQAKFISRVMKTGDRSLLVIPFMHKGLRVNFTGSGVQIHMEVPDGEGNNWTFKNCKIDTVKKNGLIYHRIVSPMSEGIENRRGEHRTYVWQPAIFTIEGVADQVFSTLKDVIRRERMDQYILYGCRSGEKNQEVMDYIERLDKNNPDREKDSENGGQ